METWRRHRALSAAGLPESKLPLQTAFIFNQELQGAATSCSPGKSQMGKKGTSCYIHPLAKVEKLSNKKQLSLVDEDLLQSKGCAHFSSLFSTTEKCQRASGSRELLPLLYPDKEVSPATAFSDLSSKRKMSK